MKALDGWSLGAIALGLVCGLVLGGREWTLDGVWTFAVSGVPHPACPDLPQGLRDRLGAERQAAAQAEQAFQARWGTMIPPPVPAPARDAESLKAGLLAAPGVRWATADCSFWPCVGLVLYEGDRSMDQLRDQLGVPQDAPAYLSNLAGRDDLYIGAVTFDAHALTEDQLRWATELMTRAVLRERPNYSVVAAGYELAEP